MVFVYIRIYFAAKARARRGIKKKPLKSAQEQVYIYILQHQNSQLRLQCSSWTFTFRAFPILFHALHEIQTRV